MASGTRTAPFFVLTFLFTWGLQVPGVLAQRGVLGGDPRAYLPFAGLGIFGPLVAAVYWARREGGRAGVKALLSPLLRFRVHPGWYAAALVPAVLLSALLELLNLAGRHGPTAYLPALSGVVFGLVASVAEEVGWRGFALPRLERRWGGFAASGLIGLLWCLWHIPMFLGQGVPMNLMLVLLLFFVGGSLFFTWLFDGSGGSLVIAVVAHLGAHLNNSFRPLPGEVVPLVAHAIVFAGLGLFVMRKTLAVRAGATH
ncbi:MAG TPA: CPBP family intramembrane glutamic endopeptidase [Polyangiaceae bacterium]|nr:CPBP family intramembrane glutamic endopeptidase [Polyangiaceae bacterium]